MQGFRKTEFRTALPYASPESQKRPDPAIYVRSRLSSIFMPPMPCGLHFVQSSSESTALTVKTCTCSLSGIDAVPIEAEAASAGSHNLLTLQGISIRRSLLD